MTKDEALQMCLEYLETDAHERKYVRHAIKQALAAQQTCNCRWEGEVQVQQCTLHKAHVDAIHEWAERAKAAEAKLKAQPAPVQEPVAYWIPKAEQFCIADPSGRPFAKAWEPLYTTPPAAPVQEPVAWVEKNGDLVWQNYEAAIGRNLYTTPPAQEFVCSTGLCHYKATSEKRECMNCAAFGECNPNNDAGRCGYEPPAAQRQWVGLTDEEWQDLSDRYGMILFGRFKNEIETKLREKNTP